MYPAMDVDAAIRPSTDSAEYILMVLLKTTGRQTSAAGKYSLAANHQMEQPQRTQFNYIDKVMAH